MLMLIAQIYWLDQTATHYQRHISNYLNSKTNFRNLQSFKSLFMFSTNKALIFRTSLPSHHNVRPRLPTKTSKTKIRKKKLQFLSIPRFRRYISSREPLRRAPWCTRQVCTCLAKYHVTCTSTAAVTVISLS